MTIWPAQPPSVVVYATRRFRRETRRVIREFRRDGVQPEVIRINDLGTRAQLAATGHLHAETVVRAGDMHWEGYDPRRQAITIAALDSWDADPPADVTDSDLAETQEGP